jgi:predicted solute-binding protein
MHFDTLFLKFLVRRVQAKREDPGIHQSAATMDCRIKSGDDAMQEHHRTIHDAA